jgi:hypothetical protein
LTTASWGLHGRSLRRRTTNIDHPTVKKLFTFRARRSVNKGEMGRRRRSGFDVGKLWRPGRGKAVTTGPREDFELTGFRAAGFLSAVADRFGLWGPPGAPNVAWGGVAAVCRIRRETELVCPKNSHTRSGLGIHFGRDRGCRGPTYWVAVAVGRSCLRLAPDIVRCHHGDSTRDQGSIGFLGVRSCRGSISPRGDQEWSEQS